MKTQLIVNPVSGTDTGPEFLPLINERLRRVVGALDIAMTVGAEDGVAIAARAVRNGCDRLLVAGGDGTLNEVLNGVAAVEHGLTQVTLGVLPLGTGNDFAATLGAPEDVTEAVEWLSQCIDASAVRAVDVGVVNDRHFVNVSGGGFIAEVSDAVSPQLKTVAGRLAYLVGGAQVLLTHEPVRADIYYHSQPSAPERHASIVLHAFAVCNAPLIGGGRLIAPHALIDDGLLDVCLIEEMPLTEFLALLARVSNGEHVSDPRVNYFRATQVRLEFQRPVKLNTDGQVLESARCEYRLLPQAARFFARSSTPQGS